MFFKHLHFTTSFSLPNKYSFYRTGAKLFTTNNAGVKLYGSKLSGSNGQGHGRGMIPKYSPKSDNQKKYVKALNDPEVPLVFVLGPAGTGKTLFACLAAMEGLRSGAFERIIITRPVVSVGEELGFLPGNIKSKMDPWTRPIFDIFLEYYTQKDIDAMIHSGVIEISPLAFMRGRTFKRCFIMADEMQNSSPSQIVMATTRIGYGSKMVVNGDLNQSDRGVNNGLAVLVHKVRQSMKRNTEMNSSNSAHLYVGKGTGTESEPADEPKTQPYSTIAICDMDTRDVERSPIVSTILRIISEFDESGVKDGEFDRFPEAKRTEIIPHTTCKCKCSEECVEFTKAESFELRSHAYLLTTKLGDRSCSGDIMGAVADIKSSKHKEINLNHKDSDPL